MNVLQEGGSKGRLLFFAFALRPRGPRHRNASAAISLRSIPTYGGTAPAKAAYAVTGIFIFFDKREEEVVNRTTF
jgi:hypothetical protein